MRAQALVLPLPGLCSFYADPQSSPLFMLGKYGVTGAFSSRLVRHAVEFKWEQFGRRYVLQRMLLYALFLLLFCVLTLTPLLHEGYNDSATGVIHTLLEVIFLAAAVYYMQYEVRQCAGEGPATYFSSVWNFLDLFGYSMAVATCIARLAGQADSVSSRSGDAVTAILLWFKTLAFARGFKATGPFVGTLLQTFRPIGFFLVCLLVVILGFSHALHLLSYPLDRGGALTGSHLVYANWESIYNVYFAMLGQVEIDDLRQALSPGLALTLMCVFSLVATIIMLNVLIALLNDIYQRVSRNAEAEWYMERCRLVMEIENTLTAHQHNSAWFPVWLHVLEPVTRAHTAPQSSSVAATAAGSTVLSSTGKDGKSEGQPLQSEDAMQLLKTLVERADAADEKFKELLQAVSSSANGAGVNAESSS